MSVIHPNKKNIPRLWVPCKLSNNYYHQTITEVFVKFLTSKSLKNYSAQITQTMGKNLQKDVHKSMRKPLKPLYSKQKTVKQKYLIGRQTHCIL